MGSKVLKKNSPKPHLASRLPGRGNASFAWIKLIFIFQPQPRYLLYLGWEGDFYTTNDGKNNGQVTHGARNPPGPKTKVANNNGQLCIANATSGGAR